MMVIDFSHKSYCQLLHYIMGLGRRIIPFRDLPSSQRDRVPAPPKLDAVRPGGRPLVFASGQRRPNGGVPESGSYVILRHDIDFSAAKAEEIAALDHQMGVQSTFFVLLTTPYYNPLDEENLQILRRILGMGHEIGLHYDCSGFDELALDEQYHRIQTLAACLESHLDTQVTAIAQHKPSAARIHPEFPGYIDPYSQAFFKDIAYISDSRMMFRVKDVYAFFRDNLRCQAALHPIWWHAQPKTRAQIFDEIKNELAQRFSDMIDDEHRSILDFLAAYKPA